MTKKNYRDFAGVTSACFTSGDDYFSSHEYVSSSFSSAVRSPFVNQIVAGGKKVVITAALAAMLNANLAQTALAFTDPVNTTVYDELISSGAQNVVSGGIVSGASIYNGGIQNISSGGQAFDADILSGGVQNVSSGGFAINAVVNGGGVQNIHLGGIAESAVINSGTQNIYTGGGASGVLINSGGIQNIHDIAAALNAIADGGKIIGIGNNPLVAGDITVLNSGVISNVVLYGSGLLTVSNALAKDVNLLNGVMEVAGNYDSGTSISTRGLAEQTHISSGAVQNILLLGRAISTVVSNGGIQNVSRAAGASNTYISSGGIQNVLSLGFAASTMVSGGTQNVSSGVVSVTNIYNGGVQNISSGGTAYYTHISSGGVQNLSAGTYNINGGIAQYTYIRSGGTQNVAGSSALASSTNIYNGGIQNVYSSAHASNTEISSGGIQNVSSTGQAHSTVIHGGGVQNLIARGSAVNITINSGGVQNVLSGAHVSSGIINDGGVQIMSSGANVSHMHISSGGVQYVNHWAYAWSTHVSSGAVQSIISNGQARTTYIHDGGMQDAGAGNLMSTYISSGGVQNVYGGAFADTFTISYGGAQNVWGGGYAYGGAVTGGTQNISSGGTAFSARVMNSGVQNIYSGGIVMSLALSSGGTTNLYDSAITSGVFNISSAGTLNGKVSSLETLNLLSGGKWANTKDSDVQNLNLNAATVDMRSGTEAGNVLTIQNLSAANNPTIDMNVKFGDETSPSDKIIITGTHTGNTLLRLHNAGGVGRPVSETGIKVVDISAATGYGTFALFGEKIDVGAYDYFLEQNETDKNYYLLSLFTATDLYKTIANAPLINVFTARSAMAGMEGRLGDLRAFGYEQNNQGIWMRGYGKSASVKDLAETDITFFALEAGYDRLFDIFNQKIFAGITAGYMNVSDIKTKINKNSSGTGTIPSFGAYASLIGNNGFFADLAVKGILSNLEMTNYASDNTQLNYNIERNILALSFETGKSFKKELWSGNYFRIEPKAGILFMNAASGSAAVKNGVGDMEYDSADYLTANAGIILGFVKTSSYGTAIIEPLIELNYLQELLGKGKIRYDGTEHESNLSGGSVEVAAGLNARVSENIRLFGRVSYETGGKIKAAGVNVGAQYSF